MLMGRAVHYSVHDVQVAMPPSRDSDSIATRSERFRHRWIKHQRMQIGKIQDEED